MGACEEVEVEVVRGSTTGKLHLLLQSGTAKPRKGQGCKPAAAIVSAIIHTPACPFPLTPPAFENLCGKSTNAKWKQSLKLCTAPGTSVGRMLDERGWEGPTSHQAAVARDRLARDVYTLTEQDAADSSRQAAMCVLMAKPYAHTSSSIGELTQLAPAAGCYLALRTELSGSAAALGGLQQHGSTGRSGLASQTLLQVVQLLEYRPQGLSTVVTLDKQTAHTVELPLHHVPGATLPTSPAAHFFVLTSPYEHRFTPGSSGIAPPLIMSTHSPSEQPSLTAAPASFHVHGHGHANITVHSPAAAVAGLQQHQYMLQQLMHEQQVMAGVGMHGANRLMLAPCRPMLGQPCMDSRNLMQPHGNNQQQQQQYVSMGDMGSMHILNRADTSSIETASPQADDSCYKEMLRQRSGGMGISAYHNVPANILPMRTYQGVAAGGGRGFMAAGYPAVAPPAGSPAPRWPPPGSATPDCQNGASSPGASRLKRLAAVAAGFSMSPSEPASSSGGSPWAPPHSASPKSASNRTRTDASPAGGAQGASDGSTCTGGESQGEQLAPRAVKRQCRGQEAEMGGPLQLMEGSGWSGAGAHQQQGAPCRGAELPPHTSPPAFQAISVDLRTPNRGKAGVTAARLSPDTPTPTLTAAALAGVGAGGLLFGGIEGAADWGHPLQHPPTPAYMAALQHMLSAETGQQQQAQPVVRTGAVSVAGAAIVQVAEWAVGVKRGEGGEGKARGLSPVQGMSDRSMVAADDASEDTDTPHAAADAAVIAAEAHPQLMSSQHAEQSAAAAAAAVAAAEDAQQQQHAAHGLMQLMSVACTRACDPSMAPAAQACTPPAAVNVADAAEDGCTQELLRLTVQQQARIQDLESQLRVSTAVAPQLQQWQAKSDAACEKASTACILTATDGSTVLAGLQQQQEPGTPPYHLPSNSSSLLRDSTSLLHDTSKHMTLAMQQGQQEQQHRGSMCVAGADVWALRCKALQADVADLKSELLTQRQLAAHLTSLNAQLMIRCERLTQEREALTAVGPSACTHMHA